ncbi:MAG: hypothetical protein LBR18_08445 [Tannerella sp.]|jgi:hypothetical protein|nr:hypothetical protein [Tannerella sp.]
MMKKYCKNFVKCLLLVLFMSYYLSATCFYHTHYFSWGTVTHSHIYFPSGDKQPHHNHTPAQCELIQILSTIMFTFTVAVAAVISVIVSKIYIVKSINAVSINVVYSFLRAPPC